mgnify:CR=1 FL=1
MKQKQHSNEEIIRILRQAETDATIDSVCREHNVSKATFHPWKRKYGEMDLVDAKRLKELEKENVELKKMLAESLLKKSRAGRSQRKKMVSPMQKKQAVAQVVSHGLCSVRRACRYVGVHRSTYRYRAKPLAPKQIQLHQRIVVLSWQHPRYGYRRIRVLVAQEDWSVSRKQVQRVRRKEGLKVRPKPQRIPRPRDLDRFAHSGAQA